MDDAIGPTVNKPVVVRVITKGENSRFVDIEPDDRPDSEVQWVVGRRPALVLREGVEPSRH